MPVKNFSGECTMWAGYNEDLHSIKIKHIRRYILLITDVQIG